MSGIRWAAHGLLVGSATAFIGLSLWPQPPVWGLALRAMAEAATVGALADWFAVTALFRRPLGLPIPHTALLPRNKARIGKRLGGFVSDKFLDPETLARRVTGADVPTRLADLLTRADVRAGLSRAVDGLLGEAEIALQGAGVKAGAKAEIHRLLDGIDLAPLARDGLFTFLHEGHYLPLLDRVAAWGEAQLIAERPRIEAFLRDRVVAYLADKLDSGVTRLLGIDPTSLADGAIARRVGDALAEAILADATARLAQLRTPGSELAQQVHATLLQQAHRVTEGPDWAATFAGLKRHLLAPERFDPAFDGLWAQTTATITAARPRLQAGLLTVIDTQIGRLRTDEALRAAVTAQAEALVRGMIADARPLAADHIAATVTGWDDAAVTAELERAVGRDLQFIRINGTIVGGVAGLALFLIDRYWLG
ncbi:membrane protein [Elstera cyanobacteriorum]|uniref:DUF445 domain-containing protein n=1 Tax=Elstera cyanobacteriorum TaxID=2022747 RepID=A0A255XLM8_9PROT|nr:DUF445 domain-containing protein [Elstera cyanobacteriorum]OYQ17294.1 hypothetical protein CHR90_15090 [Elstera cyanobacteriorum]GFZ92862.1 membrane protein [Elstera cyanobacteriorum]